ncbi:MAG: 1-deoxy-D-xylulose-5-phosphate reductoisomerase [Bacteroidales bacterium]|nr:1-deoxy-D-xylulose-5-phosphate reductoisomerase [Bacteroidales bacterium]
MKKRIAILGSTGSIGTQALDVIRENPDHFEVEVLTAYNNIELLSKQAKEFKPNSVVIANESKYDELVQSLGDLPVKIYAGNDAISQIVEMDTIDVVLTAMVGYSGLLPTINAIKSGKIIALANKETLVVAGELIQKLALENKVSILPVDSEHSAIFQCLVGEGQNAIEKVILTASGGPFRGKNLEFLKTATKEKALKHPNWDMGAKITIDSATMMNKGLEAIEARWLFGIDPKQIEVVVHPQSIVHSAVQFQDGSIKAQMGLPDMKLPIQYAFSFPNRMKTNFPRFSFWDYPELTFEKPDLKSFRNLALAFEAMDKCGNMPCILNAANEIAVEAFLKDKIGFCEMTDLIEQSMQKITYIKHPNLDDLINTDKETREFSRKILNNK